MGIYCPDNMIFFLCPLKVFIKIHITRYHGYEMGCGGRVVEHQRGPGFKTTCGRASDFSVEGTWVQNHLLPFRNLGNFVNHTLSVSFGRDTKAVGPIYLVSMPGEGKDPT